MSGRMSKEKEALGLTKDSLNPGDPADAEKFSDIVYKPDPNGQYRGPNGARFTCYGVNSEKEKADALENGCFATAQEALKIGATPAEEVKSKIAKLKAEALEESELEELKKLEADKAEREAKKVKAPIKEQ